ncbi:msl9543 (plasmid) [Mesorhizobium japonicum MAFF 303099]|uniref:Msl9543 protein n=1 Tax=Mesorhizobium japonicum (strain LMG 29417 / CECT 9101 / MAFF 303099) TaxID=266835 RepID=Q98PA6_RHILO|nr:msl9543 [Mesorhizobium japonicum MAFF 303099]
MEGWLQPVDFEAAGFVTRIARLFAGLAETNSCGSTFNALARISTVSSVALRRPASTLLI